MVIMFHTADSPAFFYSMSLCVREKCTMPKTISDAEQWQEYLALEDQFHLLMRHQDFIDLRLRAAVASLIPNQHFREVDWSPQAVNSAYPPK